MPKIESQIHAVEWRGNRLRVLDQRKLPHQVAYLDCRSPRDVSKAIREMALRGAPLIGCAAAYGMALSASLESHKILQRDAKILIKSRPTAINLSHAVHSMLSKAKNIPEGHLFKTLEPEAQL